MPSRFRSGSQDRQDSLPCYPSAKADGCRLLPPLGADGGSGYLHFYNCHRQHHGYLRTTADLDLIVQLESSNVARALEVDLFVREPFDFDAAYDEAGETRLETTTVRVVPRRLDERLPGRDRRQVKLVLVLPQHLLESRGQTLRLEQAKEPDVGVEKDL